LELRQYAAVVRRRWPLVAVIVALTALFSLGLYLRSPLTYTAITRLSIRRAMLPDQLSTPGPNGSPAYYNYNGYYNMYSSEFLADDYAIIITSQAFAQLVEAKVAQSGGALHGPVLGSLSAERKQRELTIATVSTNPADANAIGRAVAAVVTDLSRPGSATPNLNPAVQIPDGLLFAVLDQPPPGDNAPSNRNRVLLNSAIAVGVGLALALALAFLLEYLDRSLRDAADAETVIGVPVLVVISRR